jgi:biotin synthase-related radical SAM superfamily protein
MTTKPTTAYLMTYVSERCGANCAFCAQARESGSDLSMLSRIEWPQYLLSSVLQALDEKGSAFGRICLQTLNFSGFEEVVTGLCDRILLRSKVPLSVCTPPLTRPYLERLHALGVDRICFALDASTPHLFEMMKGRAARGPYSWSQHWAALSEALQVFGAGKVTTHLIVGLGETEEELLGVVQRLKDLGILASLFAFTPLPGTKMAGHPRPSLSSYRKVQLGRYLIDEGISRIEKMGFEKGALKEAGCASSFLYRVWASGAPFQTCGCQGCNRPFYNETPRGPMYNYSRPLTDVEIEKAITEVGLEE